MLFSNSNKIKYGGQFFFIRRFQYIQIISYLNDSIVSMITKIQRNYIIAFRIISSVMTFGLYRLALHPYLDAL
ncbi:uncharacterized protein OCT59_004514 [Rhizophagus irregularis]|uniref:uncharacterized protein n=1 Tax=Rhizophagus irregularis TaxID=588596 RepID=UPI00331B736F|nr:hypothetical protein OCT59_004514 [Rhizophagus irregularis]